MDQLMPSRRLPAIGDLLHVTWEGEGTFLCELQSMAGGTTGLMVKSIDNSFDPVAFDPTLDDWVAAPSAINNTPTTTSRKREFPGATDHVQKSGLLSFAPAASKKKPKEGQDPYHSLQVTAVMNQIGSYKNNLFNPFISEFTQDMSKQVNERLVKNLLSNYQAMLEDVPGALEFAYINPIRDPWVKVRDIGFLERFAEKADQFLYKYESGLNPQEFDSEYSMCTCKFIEENREYLETCDDDEFSDWCFKEVGDGARDPKPGPHAGKSYGFAAGIFNGKFKFHDQGWYIPSQMWGGSVQDDCYIKE